MTTTPSSLGRPRVLADGLGVVHAETALVRLAMGVAALHVVDDNFLQPAPGTSPGDHLASGLVPLGVLVAAAVLYPRLRAGLRAAVAMTLGAVTIAFGLPAAYYLQHGAASGDHYTGLASIAAGLVLVASGAVTLWKARRADGGRGRRYARRALVALAAALLLLYVVFPVGFSYVYTHTGRTPVTPDLRVPYETVTVTTDDSLRLSATYVPSRNRAAVILFPGGTRSPEARMLIRHGYGVLLLDPRGQGRSEGDAVRWAGDRDLHAAVSYLGTRPDVDAERIGAMGFSIGGEILIEAAAQSEAIKAIVSEGAGIRIGEGIERSDGVSLPVQLLLRPMSYIMTTATTVFSNHGPPPPIVDRIGLVAPRSVFLVYAAPGEGGERTRQPRYYAAAGEPKSIWKVPGSDHTGGIAAQPAEYERRVVAFFDDALLGR